MFTRDMPTLEISGKIKSRFRSGYPPRDGLELVG
jgi:hypothetical protein